ncbi:ABC transporter substrate-binding protein [Peribacillus loiseleuriae]|uniref:ABC transporter substrate-binding protein n=1 Tax=Peribacillus loiseleuriae TaxID=1679170 RepID=A0A0K9GVI6_9BACI|nr:ABC transporter substrate-binding protein [Peribacillus loiseleuriae]KMY50704.1 ABC transporter substrate-binding protein [Peribacillus loiseleuriae]
MRNTWLKTAAVGLTATVLLAGCGSSNTSSSSGSEDASSGKTYQIGVSQIVQHASLDEAYKGFQEALKDKGIDAKYDEQNAQGDPNNSLTIAQNFVGKNVDLIFANSTPSAMGALTATKDSNKDIPIVFTSVTDPVAAELVESLEAPGGNVTGTTDTHPDAIANSVKFIAEELGAKTIGTVYNSGEQNSIVQINMLKAEADKHGIKVVEASAATSADVKQATESLVGKADAFFIVTDNTVVSALEAVIMVANEKKIPLFVGELDSVARGGFAAYGFSYHDIGYEAGEMAADILLNGTKPSELPVQYPQNLKLVINEKAAKEMGIELKEEWKSEAEFIK